MGAFHVFKILHGCFSRFLNCTNGYKSRNTPHNDFLYHLVVLNITFATIPVCNYFTHDLRLISKQKKTSVTQPRIFLKNGLRATFAKNELYHISILCLSSAQFSLISLSGKKLVVIDNLFCTLHCRKLRIGQIY